MNSPKWTPGPWRVERGNVGTEHPLFVVAQDRDGLRPWTDEDAHLISAAQRLWHALVGILESLDDAARNNPEAWLEFINEIAVDLPVAMAFASTATQQALGESRGRPVPTAETEQR